MIYIKGDKMVKKTVVEKEDDMMISVNSYVVHRKNQSRIFGEGNTTVSLEDEGAGEFLRLEQHNAERCDATQAVRLDFDEFDTVIEAVLMLKESLK